MRLRLITAGTLTLLVLALVSCGTGNVGTLTPERGQDRQGTGVTLDGYEVIRYNEQGDRDPQLNSTLRLELDRSEGQTALIISVTDADVNTVALDVHYDAARVHPISTEFHGLMGRDGEVLSASWLDTRPGLAAVAESGVHGYRAGQVDGRFATLRFAPGSPRRASGVVGGVHSNPRGVAQVVGRNPDDNPNSIINPGHPNLVVVDADPNDTLVGVQWYAGWHRGDGDQNSEANPADIARIAFFLGQNVNTNWGALVADYDQNGEVNPADLAPLGKYLNEGTTEYLVQAGDDAGGALTDLSAIGWNDGVAPPPGPPAGNTLGDVFRTWTLDFSDSSAFTYQQLSALDTSQSGFVRLVITPSRTSAQAGTTTGAPSEIIVPVSDSIVIVSERIVTIGAVTFRAEGATGGDGPNGDIFSEGTVQGQVEANGDLNLTLESISGNYISDEGNGPFDSTSFPADMTQEDYDFALAAARDAASWVIENGGAAGARRTSDWFVPPPPGQGDPGLGTVFPDDDPESTGATSEGRIAFTLNPVADFDPAEDRKVEIIQTLAHTLRFDVGTDPEAVVLEEVRDGSTGAPLVEFIRNQNNTVVMNVQWGAGGAPADLSDTSLELLRFDTNGLLVGNPIPLNYSDAPSGAGEYTIRDLGVVVELQAIVSGVTLVSGAQYHFRLQANNIWSSVNKPEELVGTAPPPPPTPLESIPNSLRTGNNTLQIFQEDPRVRRDPRVTINQIDKILTPTNETAYNDVLKMTGTEFLISISDTGTVYPVIIVASGTDPDVITWESRQPAGDGGPIWTENVLSNDEGEPGWLLVSNRHPGRIVVDLGALPPTGDDPEPYVYKLFSEDGSTVGAGSFNKAGAFPLPVPSPTVATPNSWGVNVFNRNATASLTLGQRDYGDVSEKKTVQGNTVDTDTPDVLWFEFRDGWVFSSNPQNNVRALIDAQNEGIFDARMNIDLRIIGVDNDNQYIAIAPLQRFHFFDPDDPRGNLFETETYDVRLDDPTKPGDFETSYDKTLFVGSMPPPLP